jgi:TRAP-type mannitol/chloroaromatic compound transport system permease large subunit
MSGDDGPEGNYIIITREQYDVGILAGMIVENGTLIKRDPVSLHIQLKKSSSGYPVVKNHPALILESYEEYTGEIEFYDRNS